MEIAMRAVTDAAMNHSIPNTVRYDAREWSRRRADISDAERLAPVHTGTVLEQDFLIPGGLTEYRLATDTRLTPTHIGQIIAGTRAVTAQVALRFAAYFGTSPELWTGLQARYDLEVAAREMADELASLPTVAYGANDPAEGEGVAEARVVAEGTRKREYRRRNAVNTFAAAPA